MKTTFYLLALTSLLLTACGNHETRREYRSSDGSVVAIATYQGDDSLHATWTFTDAKGNPYVRGCDSLHVLELGAEGHPKTVVFFLADHRQRHIQFHDKNMRLRSDGYSIDGLRTGTWYSFFPNGFKQSEGNYFAGREEGTYKVFYETGLPFYIGQYHEGHPCGTWEFYDEDGKLEGTKDYGEMEK